MPRTGSPARLIVALSVAGVLAIFLVYVAIAGGGTPQIRPSQLEGRTGKVVLTGKVVEGSVTNLARGVRFRLRDVDGTSAVPIVYRDSVPDQFRAGRDLSVSGHLSRGIFIGQPGTMMTKCPSKYTPAKSKT